MKYIPDVIKAASESPLGIVALIILVVSFLAYAFFRKSSQKRKLTIFLIAVSGFALFVMAVTRINRMPDVFVGRISDARSGRPIGGAKVTIEQRGPSEIVYTSTDGEFTGKQEANASASIRARVEANGFRDVEQLVTFDAKARFEIRLDPLYPGPEISRWLVAGRVIDRRTKEGIGQAQISDTGSAGSATYVTEDNGNFRFDGPPSSDGRTRLQVRKDGYEILDTSVAPPVDNWIVLLSPKRR